MLTTYDGKNLSGFQKQKNGVTVQGELERALSTIFKKEIDCVGSGRTDAGVSAYIQPVHFNLDEEIAPKKFVRSMNGILPSEIRVLSITKSNIHARFSAKRKTYLYRMYMSEIDLPLYSYALKISPSLNIKAMKKFLHLLVGTHDFKGFQSSGSETETTVRTIYSAKLKRHGLFLDLYITGNGFLYKMVRNIVGTMLKVGEEKISLNSIKYSIFTDFHAKFTAKPEFLYLFNVVYPKEKQ